MSGLRLIGYWRGDFDDVAWPDVHNFVDVTWPSTTRDIVVAYLVRGRKLRQYRGLSPCRFCRCHNGSQEFTDEVFLWPEGLAHYVRDHNVRLPDEFVRHVDSSTASLELGPAPEFDHLGQRIRHTAYDDEYDAWIAGFSERFETYRATGVESPPDWLNADADVSWWRTKVAWDTAIRSV